MVLELILHLFFPGTLWNPEQEVSQQPKSKLKIIHSNLLILQLKKKQTQKHKTQNYPRWVK